MKTKHQKRVRRLRIRNLPPLNEWTEPNGNGRIYNLRELRISFNRYNRYCRQYKFESEYV